MDSSTQHNAALVEESAAAATALRDQADKLAEVVALFHIDPNTMTAPKAAPAPAPAPTRAVVPVKTSIRKPAPKAAATEEWETF
jgi:methyl-accepting chemotaxis protein